MRAKIMEQQYQDKAEKREMAVSKMKMDRKHFQSELQQKQTELKQKDEERKLEQDKLLKEKTQKQFIQDMDNIRQQESKQGAYAQAKKVSKN